MKIRNNNKKNKRGISVAIVTLLLVLLSIFLVSIVWVFVNNFLIERLDEAGSCFGISEKVTLNSRYTCYDFPIGESTEKEIQFSINIGDIEIDSLLVSIQGLSSFENFEMTNDFTSIPKLRDITGGFGDPITLPNKNSGKTYAYEWDYEEDKKNIPISIQISPKIGDTQCQNSDSLSPIERC